MTLLSKMLLIGCGNMGGAMLEGWLNAGEPADRFAILDPGLNEAPEGVTLYKDAKDVAGHDCVMLGFKPQQLSKLAPQFQPLMDGGVTVFSLLAGVDLGILKEAFPSAEAHVRVVPNLAARLNKSPVLLVEAGLDEELRQRAQSLFGALGGANWITDENQFDLVTALVGSGPAFVYRFIDALGSAGAELGLDPDQAQRMALQMVEGAAALAAQSPHSPAELAERVASPGGVTREGLNVLDHEEALKTLMNKTLDATARRGSELAELARKQG